MAFPGYENFGAPDFLAGYGAYAAVPFAAAPGPAIAGYGSEDLRTVFITGFPNDIKERELNNLLRFIPGYEASQMNWRNGQAQGFALFIDGAAARAACDQIAGLCFDDGVHLRAEMARKNMYIKDGPPEVGNKRPRTTGTFTGAVAGGYNRAAAGVYAPVSNTRDNPPCNTLFVGNLSDSVDEAELQGLFSPQPGFVQLKVVRNSRNISCFVEFDSMASAKNCHETQQGFVLQSSDRGPIRIQYSKNPLGKKRDPSGQMIDTTQRGAPVPPEQAAALTAAYPASSAGGSAATQYAAPVVQYGGPVM